jgi:hypothetical protein
MEVLYCSENDNSNGRSSALIFSRLIALLNNTEGERQLQSDGCSSEFIDLDAIPESDFSFADGLKVLLSMKEESLRMLLEPEIDNIMDILFRHIFLP